MPRRPEGFRIWGAGAGYVFTRIEEDGRWVILAGPPDVKLDNRHGDRRPHVHVGGWDSADRRALRADLAFEEAVDEVRGQLLERGRLDAARLVRELR